MTSAAKFLPNGEKKKGRQARDQKTAAWRPFDLVVEPSGRNQICRHRAKLTGSQKTADFFWHRAGDIQVIVKIPDTGGAASVHFQFS